MSQVLTQSYLVNRNLKCLLPNAYYAIYAVTLNGQPMAEEEYSFTLLIVTITPTLANGVLHVLYGTNASANNAPYYTQAQTEGKKLCYGKML
jgi:hypothetical protein